ncbi:MAG: fimbrial protein [Oscillospiraceae bacterium]|nr:fimbrial protein [Oscillospiraceae bacterium]
MKHKLKIPVLTPQSLTALQGPRVRHLYTAFLIPILLAAGALPALAAPSVWEKASEIMKDVYNQILLISTIAAVVTAAVALLLMNFSKNGKTVDESRSWLKRIIITWAILNGLGFIMSYVTPFFADGKWNA